MSSSAINTWVAEELRTVGAELSLSRRLAMFGGTNTISLQGAIFLYNDPAGSLLAWKGWSVHDRQSHFGYELPLPPLSEDALTEALRHKVLDFLCAEGVLDSNLAERMRQWRPSGFSRCTTASDFEHRMPRAANDWPTI